MPAHHPGDRNAPDADPRRLPFGGTSRKPIPRRVIGHHLLLTLYGHWLPNDLRGSNSTELRQDKLAELGPILPGRQPIQPSRQELKAFYSEANELLAFRPFWIDHAKRQALADAFRAVVQGRYTVWACAICGNHAHFGIRAHRDAAETMWNLLTDAGRKALRAFPDVDPDHPIWTRAPWNVFLYTPDQVWDRIGYINANPLKERLPPQHWPFVVPYDNWPLHKGNS